MFQIKILFIRETILMYHQSSWQEYYISQHFSLLLKAGCISLGGFQPFRENLHEDQWSKEMLALLKCIVCKFSSKSHCICDRTYSVGIFVLNVLKRKCKSIHRINAHFTLPRCRAITSPPS